jgi:hypothetical protein
MFDGLLIFNIFKVKIDCHSIMDTFSLRVHTKLIREFPIFTKSSSVRSNPSAEYISPGRSMCQFIGVSNMSTVSLEDILSL